MTVMVLTLLIFLLMLVVLVGSIGRLGGVKLDAYPFERRDILDSSASAETYRPLGRLFSAEDSAFLRRFGGRGRKLAQKLGSGRSRVLRLYLRQIRADFHGLWRLAREIAPRSSNPEFGALVAKQWITFHVVLACVHVRSWLGWHLAVPVHVDGLISSLEDLRRSVVVVVDDLDSSTRQGVF